MLRRIRKEEVQRKPEAQKPDPLEVCLECWKLWMLSDDRDLSASRMKLHAGPDDEDDDEEHEGYESNVYDEQRIADHRIGEATGAMIEDMKPAWRWAIYRRCGIATQWKFPLLDFVTAVIAAEEELRCKLQKNIATAPLF